MSTPRIPTVRIYHNNLWARYKGAIFSKIYSDSKDRGVDVAFVQIAETSIERAGLGGADLSYHLYPYKLLFHGPQDDLSRFKLVLAVAADLLRNRSDLVVLPGYHRVEYWTMLVLCMLLRRKRAVFCDSTAYDRERSRWKERAKAFFFKRCDGFFCYGSRSKEYIEGYGVDAKKIYHRCQAAALPHDYDAAAVLEHFEENRSTCAAAPKFLYVGRLSQEKGLDNLLDAFRLVLQQVPQASLEIVGYGPLADNLREMTRRLGIESAVAFLGPKNPNEIGTLLMNSTAMVLPSRREPWGLVVNEALSYGCPVVVSHVCGCVPELVSEGVTGFSYPAGDVPALGAAMIAVWRLSKDRLSVAKQCLQRIEQFTPDRAASEILSGCVCLLKTPQ